MAYRFTHYQKRVKPTYRWHPTKSMRGSVITLLAIMAIVIYLGNTSATLAYRTGQAQMASSIIAQRDEANQSLTSENEALKAKLEASSKITVDDKTKALVEFYIQKYFGTAAPQAEKVFKCESGLSPMAVGQNRDYWKSVDRGVAQLNSKWQSGRFERLTGVKFELGAHDIEMNIRVAASLYQEQGWSPWVCSKLI